jgi:methionyl-tRNA formyltransferase
VPQRILAQLGYGAYNFHPGPPLYPGLVPAYFALYDNAAEFGATMHKMVARVDAGPIVDIARFPVPAGISIFGLEGLAYAHLARLFWQRAHALATQATPLAEIPIRWGHRRSSRASLRAICDIPLDIGRDELDRRIHAFGFNLFGIAPTVRFHGVAFQAVLPSASARAGAETQFTLSKLVSEEK